MRVIMMLLLAGSVFAGDLVWDGSSVWTMNAGGWLQDGNPVSFQSGDNALIQSGGTVTFGNEITAGEIVVDSGSTVSMSSDAGKRIVGATRLIKRGTGKLQLTAAEPWSTAYHTFTGDVVIDEGTVEHKTTSTETTNPTYGLLGNPSQPGRRIIVNGKGILAFGTYNLFGTGRSTPAVELLVLGGTVTQTVASSSNPFGPTTFSNATVTVGGGAGNWPTILFNDDVRFLGTNVYQLTGNGTVGFGYSKTPEVFVQDITGDSGIDVYLPQVIDMGGERNSSFVKTGPGTISLASTGFSGDLTIRGGSVVSQVGFPGTPMPNRTVSLEPGTRLVIPYGNYDKTLIPSARLILTDAELDTESKTVYANNLIFGDLILSNSVFTASRAGAISATHLALNGRFELTGTNVCSFSGGTGYLFFLNPARPELKVDDVTGDANPDLIFGWPVSDFYTNGLMRVATSGFRKTGPGTLLMTRYESYFTGDVAVEDGRIQLSAGQGNLALTNNLLGLYTVPHTVSVFTNAVLEFLGDNTIASGLTEPKIKVAVIGGTLKMAAGSSNCFGPMDISDATFDYTTSYSDSWPVMIFNGLTRFFGSTPIAFKSGASFGTGFGFNSVFEVSDITASSAVDVTFASPFITIGQSGSYSTAQFRKTGAGTLRLAADNTATGVLTVAEGVLCVDGKWNQSNSRIETVGGWVSGTGTVRQVTFNGGGLAGTQGQSVKLTIGTAEFGESGNILLYPEGKSVEQLRVNLAAVQNATGAANLKKWTVTAYGLAATPNLSAELKNGILTAGWNPQGTRIILR